MQRHDALFSTDYAYFSSFSSSWLAHAERYVDEAMRRVSASAASRWSWRSRPTTATCCSTSRRAAFPASASSRPPSTAEAARAKGIETIGEFFGADFAAPLRRRAAAAADLIARQQRARPRARHQRLRRRAARGCSRRTASITFEFPHLLRLVQREPVRHRSTTSTSRTCRCAPCSAIFAASGLAVFDVEELPTHGGRLRVWAQHAANPRPVERARRGDCWPRKTPPACAATPSTRASRRGPTQIKDDLLGFLIEQKRAGRTVAAYGAAAKGNTLLNYAGVRPDLLPFVVDASRQAGPLPAGQPHPGRRTRGAAASTARTSC